MLREHCRKLNIRIVRERIGEDILLIITGGDRPHVGAVSVCDPAAAGDRCPELVLDGHRDDAVSRPIAIAAAETTGRKTTVLCGLHYDRFTAETRSAVEAFATELEREIRDGRFLSDEF